MSNSTWEASEKDRHLSSLASDFSAALDSIFDTDDSLFSLSVDVQQKKEAISSHNKELEALEAQLKETENRLKRAKRQSLAQSSPVGSSAGPIKPQELPVRSNNTTPTAPAVPASQPYHVQRPKTATAGKPGISPVPSQSSMRSDYIMVDHSENRRPATSQRA